MGIFQMLGFLYILIYLKISPYNVESGESLLSPSLSLSFLVFFFFFWFIALFERYLLQWNLREVKTIFG